MNTSNINNRRILFLGYAVPEEIFNEVTKTEKFPQIQGTKLIWRIIKGIEESSGICLDLISAVPASNYPDNSKLIFSYKKWKHNDDAKDYIMPYINILIMKHITRFISSFLLVSRWLIKNKNESRHIIIYAMHSPFMLAAVLSLKLFGGKLTTIVPDLPVYMGDTGNSGFLKKWSKKLDVFLNAQIIRKMDGLVVLTKHIAEYINCPRVPYIVMEGSVSPDECGPINVEKTSVPSLPNIIMYAGLLSSDYGIGLLLDAFKLIDSSQYQLWICGKGTMEKDVLNAAKQNDRIVYWGLLSNKDVMTLATKATVLINPRPADNPFTKYSFPSKILEYMTSGRPVMTTNLPGIPEEYHKYLYVIADETPHGLAKFVEHICSKSPQELSTFGYAAQEFVKKEKNYLKQGQRIYEFITSLE